MSPTITNVTRDGDKFILKNCTRAVRVDPLSPVSVNRAAKTLGCSAEEVYAATSPTPEPTDFVVTVGDTPYSGATPLAALDAALAAAEPDAFMRWQGGLAAVDIDVTSRRSFDWVVDLAERAGAARAWLTKSGGGRLIFTDEGHAAAAIVLLDMGAPEWVERVELLINTRAPRDEVWSGVGSGLDWLVACAKGEEIAEADVGAVNGWLESQGLRQGRNSHDLCPINPSAGGAGDPVMVLERGVYCHRCAGVDGDGWRPWAKLLGVVVEPHPLVVAARECVHWGHMDAVLRANWDDRVPWRVARIAYEALLPDGASDAVFEPNWKWFRTESGAWVNPISGEVETPGEGITTLSWTQGNPTRRALARNTSRLPGMAPVRVTSVCLRPDAVPEGVVVWAKRKDVNPRRDGLLSWRDAFARLCEDFPCCSEVYLQAILVAAVCAEGGRGKYALLATGSTGTAKSTVPRVAAGILGSAAADLRLDVSTEEWARQVGQALEKGSRPLVCNEVDKVPQVRRHIGKLLRLEDPHQWRPLYGSDIRTKWRAPLVITAITAPEPFADPEVGRRVRHVHLVGRVPSWYGRALEDWRFELDDPERSIGLKPGEGWRPLVADSLLRWAIDFAAQHRNDWDTAADALGLESSDRSDADVADIEADAFRRLYQHCCDPNERTMSTSARYPEVNHWVDLRSPEATKILEPCWPDSESSAYYVMALRLNSADWAGLVGAPVRCEARHHGQRLVIRFGIPGSGQTGGLRGRWTYNESCHVMP